MKANKLNDEESAEKLMEEFGEEVEEKLRLGLSKRTSSLFIMSILRSTLYSSTTKRYFVVLMLTKAGMNLYILCL